MKIGQIALGAALLVAALPLAALAQGQQQPAQKGPHPKSQKEVQALQKVQADQQAGNWDQEIQDINGVLENFADTEFKPQLLAMAMDAAQRKGDYAQTVAFGEKALDVNPNDIQTQVLMAETIASHTRENDLDKDQSIKKVQDYANKALEQLKTATTAPAGMNEAQWPDLKKLLTSQAYDALGQAADLDKKFPDAINHFKTAIDADATNSVPMARLAKAYNDNKQYDDAISTADKVLALNTAPAAVKQFAQQQKDAATKLKGAAPK